MRGVVLMVLLLAGCSYGPPMHFEKEGATDTDYRAATYNCERDARLAFPNAERWQIDEIRGFLRRCMIAQGWTEVRP